MTTPSSETPPKKHLLLRGSDLFVKKGFADGEIIDDLLEEAGFDPVAPTGGEEDPLLGAEVLARTVVAAFRDLLPTGTAIETGVSHSHNPVRLDPARLSPETRKALEEAVVRVDPDDVIAIAAAVRAESGPSAPRF
jgi:hypothetical protein